MPSTMETTRKSNPRMPAKPNANELKRVSSMGIFDRLAIELIENILNELDFRSLQRFRQTSSRARVLVDRQPGYRQLLEHASPALGTLQRSGLLGAHSLGTLYQALRRADCDVCGSFAPYLYLTTCERHCLGCVTRQRSLRMVPTFMAPFCFALDEHEMQNLPQVLSDQTCCSDSCFMYSKSPCKESKRLIFVSVKQAEGVAIAKHGSREEMERVVEERDSKRRRLVDEKRQHQRWRLGLFALMKIEPLPPMTDMLTFDQDPYELMGSTPMSWSPRQGTLREGTWCDECFKLHVEYFEMQPKERGPPGPWPGFPAHRTRVPRMFRQHARTCPVMMRSAKAQHCLVQ